MKQDLNQWLDDNMKGSLENQIMFVRYKLPELLFSSYEEAQKHQTVVIASHRSKSITLPVYQITLPGDIVITLRNNFHDWKISISSPKDVEIDVMGLFDPEKTFSSCYFEGFPEHLVYGSYAANKKQFSFELSNQYDVYTFFWIFGAKMGLRQQ